MIQCSSRPCLSLLFGSLVWLLGCSPAVQSIPAPAGAGIQVTELQLKTPGGPAPAKLIRPLRTAGEIQRRPALLLLHEDHGLTDWEIDQGRRLAEAGYVVLAVDLYGGQKVDNVMDAHIMGRAIPEHAVQAALQGALDYLTTCPDVIRDRLGVIGWDIGGGYALDIARHDPRIRCCVLCYGGVVTDPTLLAGLNGPVLGIFGAKDVGISAETLKEFRKGLESAGKKHEIQVFANSPHGFMNPASPEAGGTYDAGTAQAAWDRILTFLAAELKKP
jgi:carboxymethylenebutenolidase